MFVYSINWFCRLLLAVQSFSCLRQAFMKSEYFGAVLSLVCFRTCYVHCWSSFMIVANFSNLLMKVAGDRIITVPA